MGFDYVESWRTDPTAIPLSQSLPLTKKHFSRNDCRGFFAGILPDDNQREVIARNLGISARNDFAMLERIGGECAGAVTFLPEGKPLPERDYAYRPISPSELAEILRTLPRRPLLAGEEGIRLSLAGAQDKVVVHVSDGRISIPLSGAPSTHILKPAIERFQGLVFNEAWENVSRRRTSKNWPKRPVSRSQWSSVVSWSWRKQLCRCCRLSRPIIRSRRPSPSSSEVAARGFCEGLSVQTPEQAHGP
jgi:HipA-like protein